MKGEGLNAEIKHWKDRMPEDKKGHTMAGFAVFQVNLHKLKSIIRKYGCVFTKITTLYAEKHSVSFQIDPKFQPQTLNPLPEDSTTTTKFVFSLRTEPERKKSWSSTEKTPITTAVPPFKDTTGTGSETNSSNPDAGTITPFPDKKTKHEVKYTGHQPGAVAGTTIAMLLVGVPIGAGATFYKFNGLPECMRR